MPNVFAPTDPAKLYELLVSELVDFAVFLTDAAGVVTSWNPGVERIPLRPLRRFLDAGAVRVGFSLPIIPGYVKSDGNIGWWRRVRSAGPASGDVLAAV